MRWNFNRSIINYLIIIVIILILLGAFLVSAQFNPSIFGHKTGEIDWQEPIIGDVQVQGSVDVDGRFLINGNSVFAIRNFRTNFIGLDDPPLEINCPSNLTLTGGQCQCGSSSPISASYPTINGWKCDCETSGIDIRGLVYCYGS